MKCTCHIIGELKRAREDILDLPFTPEKSIQVDRIDAVIDYLKEIDNDNS